LFLRVSKDASLIKGNYMLNYDNSSFCEARPDLSGALFVFLKTKKRERRADKGAPIQKFDEVKLLESESI
jgi:hypothetical protein